MSDMRKLLPLLVLWFSVACSSTPAPAPKASPVPAATQAAASLDGAAYRKELEEAYNHILAREVKPTAPNAVVPSLPVVDLEAAVSIPIPTHRTIDSSLTYFTGGFKTSIQTSLIRSGKYRKLIDRALEEQKLPKGLAYLPVIESAYMPTLTSRAGAHGIWQFMPDTAREYGLRVDWWVDERADPERSTRAAAKYLKDLYRQFNDWSLALAAYNCGPGRVRRALASTGATTFWELLEQQALPKETRGYVPTFFATLMIATDPESYGFRLGTATEFEEKRVEVEGPLSLKYLAEVARVDETVLKELNPAYRRGMLPPGRSIVRVPSRAAEAVAARATTMKHDDATIAVCSYTLRNRDSLKHLARSLGTDVETILAMNDLATERSARSGASIFLPVRARELGSLLAERDDLYYAVKKGDTLYSVAKRHDLTVDELRELNDLAKDEKLRPGQKLRVTASRAVTAGM